MSETDRESDRASEPSAAPLQEDSLFQGVVTAFVLHGFGLALFLVCSSALGAPSLEADLAYAVGAALAQLLLVVPAALFTWRRGAARVFQGLVLTSAFLTLLTGTCLSSPN